MLSRVIAGLIAMSFVFGAAPAAAETMDYSTLWAHLSDQEVERFLYDCGGLVDVALKGNFAYTVDDFYGLQVIECGDPSDLVYRGFVGLGSPRRCDVRDHYVYVLDSTPHIDIVDVDLHDEPVQVSELTLGVLAYDLLVIGPWLYVTTSDDELRIYSLASATAPVLANTVVLPVDHARRLVLVGDRVVAAGDEGLVVLSATVPEWPTILGSLPLPGDTWSLSARGDLALVGQIDQCPLVDIADPANMIETAAMPGRGFGVLLTSDGQAWIGAEDCWASGGLRIYDVGDPAAPVLLHDEIRGFRGAPNAMFERDGLVYAAEHMCWCAGEWPGFHVLKMGRLPLPEPLAVMEPGGWGLLGWGSQVDMGTGVGLQSWDLSDPRQPQFIDSVGDEYAFLLLAEDGGRIVTNRFDGGSGVNSFQVVTRALEGSLTLRGSFPLPARVVDLDVSGAWALVAVGSSPNVLVVDVQDPDAPQTEASVYGGESIESVALHGRLAAVSDGGADLLRLFDLTDPQNPVELATVPHGEYPMRTALEFVERDGRLWLLSARNWGGANYNGGKAEIFDVTDPAAPRLAWSQRQLAIDEVREPIWQGDVLIVPSSFHLTFYRCSDPDLPVEFVGRVPFYDSWYQDFGRHTAVTATSVVTVGPQDPARIFPLPEGVLTAAPESGPVPAVDGLQAVAVPNPFNPRCELRVTVPTAGELTVDVFDARGRRVRALGADRVEAGLKTVRWDGRDDGGRTAPAGIYLARVRVGGHTTSVKLTLAK